MIQPIGRELLLYTKLNFAPLKLKLSLLQSQLILIELRLALFKLRLALFELRLSLLQFLLSFKLNLLKLKAGEPSLQIMLLRAPVLSGALQVSDLHFPLCV